MIQNINIGAAPNDKTGDKARVAGGKINANFAYLEGKIDNVDKIVSETGFSLVDLVFTINAFWEWNLNGIGYTNPEAVSINIPLCASGKKRIDYIVPNSSNTFTIISGIETTGIPAAPSIPNKDMYVSFFTITDILIESPALTIIGENYISKLEKIRLDNVNGIGSYEDWTVGDSRSCFNFSNAVTEFKSFHYHPIVFAYDGKIFTLKNSQATDITLFHNAGTGLFKFRFPNAENFVLHPNEVIEFRLNYEDTSVPKLEFIGTINSISTVEISNVTGLPEALDLKLDASAYNEYFKGKYTSSGALTTANPTATDGDYAIVDAGTGVDAKEWIWDNEAGWIVGGATGASTTDALPEGSTNLYFTVGRFLTNLTLANIVAALGYTPSTAPNDAQKNSNITKAEIEAKLTGEITTHTHPAVGGGGDMVLASTQTVSGLKTFLSGMFGLRNVANTFTSFFTNANTAARTYTLQDRNGTLLDNTDLSTINTSISGKMANPSGTTDYLLKFLTATTIGNSRLRDTGTYFGIGTVNAPTKDLTFGNQTNVEVGIEESSNTIKGQDLSLSAGRTIDFVYTNNFISLNKGVRNWTSICGAANGNVYASVYSGGDIYMQTSGAGNFVALGQTARNWQGITAAPNGNIYATEYSGDIYMQTNGVGNFVALGQTSRVWHSIAAAPNGNIYATEYSGDIYMQTNGAGNFVALGQTSRVWQGIAAAPNGNIYACVGGGDIYMQTSGAGNFVALGQTARSWVGMTAAPNGNIYASVYSGDIYMQTSGAGNFVALGQTTRNYRGMGSYSNGNIYAVTYGEIYMQQNNGVGAPNLDGGSLINKAGTGKGTGASNWEVYTGQKTTSGTNMQTQTLRVKINNEGKTSFYGIINLKGYTVSTLPTGVVGDTAYVTDATSPTFLSTVVGGGSVKCRVFFDGTNWIVN